MQITFFLIFKIHQNCWLLRLFPRPHRRTFTALPRSTTTVSWVCMSPIWSSKILPSQSSVCPQSGVPRHSLPELWMSQIQNSQIFSPGLSLQPRYLFTKCPRYFPPLYGCWQPRVPGCISSTVIWCTGMQFHHLRILSTRVPSSFVRHSTFFHSTIPPPPLISHFNHSSGLS